MNSSYARPKPQILLSVTLETEESQSSQSGGGGQSDRGKNKTAAAELTLTLDPSGGFYQLGAVGVAQQEMFMLSLTLQNAKELPPVSSTRGHEYSMHCHSSLVQSSYFSLKGITVWLQILGSLNVVSVIAT